MIIYAQFAMLFFTLLFTRGFLHLRQQHRGLDDGFFALLGLIALCAAITPLLPAADLFSLYWALMLLASALTLTASITCILRGYRPARFLILGQVIVALGIFETGAGLPGRLQLRSPRAGAFLPPRAHWRCYCCPWPWQIASTSCGMKSALPKKPTN